MKRKKPIIGLIAIILIILILSLATMNHSTIRTIKSEKQLMKMYDGEDINELSLIERILTLPFSILVPETRNYSQVKSWGVIDYVEDATSGSSEISTNETTKDYSKTNIQVEGVDEADIIKTDGDYIYSISDSNVIITNAKDSKNVKIESTIEDASIPNELLLYKNYLVVIASNKNSNYYNQNTIVSIYNIDNKKSPIKVKSFELKEPYYTTRCIDGKLYILSKGYLRKKDKKIDRSYKEDNKTKEIDLSHIKYIKDNWNNIQTLIAEVDLKEIRDIKLNSYLIDISNAYVSSKNIYLVKEAYESGKINILSLFSWKGIFGLFEQADEYSYGKNSFLYKFKINEKEGVSLEATRKIEGRTINQYSLDEKDNNLRIALETTNGTRVAILDKKLNIIGETEEVAPGELMYASRFIGDKAYLVTYENTDPLFVIDLSNPKKPEVMGELEIPGYSMYLHPYDSTHLIGIGMDSKEEITRDSEGKVISSWARITGMKMCLFDVSDINHPKEIAKTTIGDSRTVSAILTNPKALLFSKEKNLLAIPVNYYPNDFSIKSSTNYEEIYDSYYNYSNNYTKEGYFVYHINVEDGFELRGVITHDKTTTSSYSYYVSKLLRGLYIDNNLYTISEEAIKVNSLEDLKEISNLMIKSKGVEKNEK